MKSSSFKDGSPWKKIYRSYQYFDVHLSKVALQEKLMHLENDAHSAFRAFAILLNIHTPLKTKILR